MTIISSQHYRDWDIVEAKEEALRESGATKVTIPCRYIGSINGTDYAYVYDGHHTLSAAQDLDLEIEYDVEDDEYKEFWSPEDLLEQHWMDGDWYNVETSDASTETWDLTDFAA